MGTMIRNLIVSLLPDISYINPALYLLIPILMIYFLRVSRSFVASLVAILIILQVMTPISYEEIVGARGMQLAYLAWVLVFLAVLFSRLSSGKSLRLGAFFRWPLVLLLAVYFTSWMMTLLAGPDHGFFISGFSVSQLIFGYFLSPIQVVMTGWMVMLVSEKPEDRMLLERSILIAAIIFGALVTFIYLKTGALSGSGAGLAEGRTATSDILGLKSNGLGGLMVYFYIASITMKEHKSKWLSIIAIAVSMTGILFTLSRMAWYAALFVSALMAPKFRWRTRLIVIVMLLGLYWQFHTLIINRAHYGFEKDTADEVEKWDNVTAGRLTIWQDAFKQIKEHPILGTGIQSKIFMEDDRLAGHPHNAYIRVLVDMGVVGIITVFICMSYFLLVDWKLKGPLFFSVLAMFCMGFVGHVFNPHKENYQLWIYYGLTLNESEDQADDSAEQPLNQDEA